jgi:hypothetical protein
MSLLGEQLRKVGLSGVNMFLLGQQHRRIGLSDVNKSAASYLAVSTSPLGSASFLSASHPLRK